MKPAGGPSEARPRRFLSGIDADTWVLVIGCLVAMGLTVWLTWGIWQPGIPFGDDNAAHAARTDFAIDELFSRGQLDGWQPTFGIGYQEFLFVGPLFTWVAALVKLLSLGLLSNLDCFKAAIVLSYVALPPAVAFLAWAFGLGKRAAGIAAVLTLTISSPLGGAGLQSIFETGLVANQVGSVFFCLGFGGMVLILRRPSPGRIVFTGVAVALVIVSHILTTMIVAFFAVALLASATVEWLLFHRPRRADRQARRAARAAKAEATAEVEAGVDGVGVNGADSVTVVGAVDTGGASWTGVVPVWPRLRALGLAALLAAGLSAFVLVPMMMHGSLRGVSTAFPDVGLGERLPAIWKGEFLFRPSVAAFVVAGLLFEVVCALRRRPLALTLVYTPIVFLVMARVFVIRMPGNIVAMQLTNRAWAYVGLVVILPLAHLVSWLGGQAARAPESVGARWPWSARRASVGHVVGLGLVTVLPLVLAVALVLRPPNLNRQQARAVRPTPPILEAASVLRDVVPDGARFVTQRLPAQELALTGMTHPDLWLPAVTGKNTLNIWNAESSSVYGPVFEGERVTTEPADEEATKLARWGVTHVVVLDVGSAPGMAASPHYNQIWANDRMRIFEVVPATGQPLPSSLVATDKPTKARVTVRGPGHYSFEVDASEPTSATLGLAWSPKWHLTVNGESVDPAPSEDRVVTLDLPAGISRIDIEYRADRWDVIGRSISLLVLVGLVVWGIRRRRPRRGRPTRRASGPLPSVSPTGPPATGPPGSPPAV